MQKTILITGCSSGIGYDAAHTLHKRGWRVFATCRTQTDCKRLRGEGLESFPLDYEDEASIKTAVAETLKRTGGTLDALYNNGAYAIPGLVQDMPRDAFRAIFEANLFGYFDLINQVLPTMLAQGHGRIINCSSVLGIGALRARGAYNATKFAIEPGPITTDIRTKSQPNFERWIDWKNSPRKSFYENVFMPRLYATGGGLDPGELPPSAVTKKLIHALESRRPRPRYFVTIPTHAVGVMKRLLTTRALDRILGKL